MRNDGKLRKSVQNAHNHWPIDDSSFLVDSSTLFPYKKCFLSQIITTLFQLEINFFSYFTSSKKVLYGNWPKYHIFKTGKKNSFTHCNFQRKHKYPSCWNLLISKFTWNKIRHLKKKTKSTNKQTNNQQQQTLK